MSYLNTASQSPPKGRRPGVMLRKGVLAAYLKANGLTRKDFAKLCGISESMVGQVMLGHYRCGQKVVAAVMGGTGLDIDALFIQGEAPTQTFTSCPSYNSPPNGRRAVGPRGQLQRGPELGIMLRGEVLAAHLKANGLTRKAFAAAYGITEDMLGQVMLGNFRCGKKTVAAIWEGTDLDFDALFIREEAA